jgi:ubiquinone/menaquinone biosynthesis C-methylase UbiE
VSRPGYIRFLSRAAPLYDAVVRPMGFPGLWDALAARAGVARGVACLDVCTGTGGVALALARRGAEVVGVDVAGGMLSRAARKARANGVAGSVRLARMDARALAFADGAFPVVTCAMAVHEMAEAEREAVLSEIARVAGERVLVADYRVPEDGAGALLFRARRAYEYLESDDFESYAARDLGERLAAARLAVEDPFDHGPYRIWPCRAGRR